MADNKRNLRTIEFDVMDAPVLMRAMSIAACTAMMCGKPAAESRLREYLEQFKAFSPPEADWFDGEDWCEIGMAVHSGAPIRVGWGVPPWEKETSWRTDGMLYVRIGAGVWRTKDWKFHKAGPQAQRLADILRDIAPMDAEVKVMELKDVA